ncbi:MAG: TonB-dependent receptor [Bacteroidales bacterium]
MKKIDCKILSGLQKHRKSKWWKVMRIVLFLITIGITQALALESYAQATRLSLNVEDQPIQKILEIIEEQTEFRFMYDATVVDVGQKRSINCQNQPVVKILDDIFEGAGITYKVEDRQIALSNIDAVFNFNQVSQQRTVSGKVTDSDGLPLPGVTVVVKGTTQGTVTNADGEYSLTNIPEDATLVFSFVGMRTQEIEVGDQSTINVTMVMDAIGIEEVVAVGYGVQKKSVVTGAISSVRADELVKMPVAKVEQALQGKVSGVVVTQNTGQPGSSLTLRVRGTGSMGYSEPLYIVDGIQMSDLSTLNPSDIESIEILKDAASGAIYGARAANGVVLVTTKKGKSGEISVNYSGSYGIQNPWNTLDLPNASEYMQLFNEARINDGLSEKFSSSDIANNKYDTNWQNEVFSKNAPITDHTISLSGGNGISNFIMSAGYFNQQGIVGSDKSEYEKYTFRLNSDHKLGKNIKLGENISYTSSNSSGISNQHGYVGVLSTALVVEPNIPVFATDPELIAYYDDLPVSPIRDSKSGLYYTIPQFRRNPLAWLASTFNKGVSNTLAGNFYLEISEIVKGLTYKSDVGFYKADGNGRGYLPEGYYTVSDIVNVRSVNQNSNEALRLQWENMISYTKTISNNNFNLLFGTSLLKENGSDVFGSRNNNIPLGWKFAWLNNGADDASQRAGGSYWENRLSSFFGRINYNYAEKYMLTATFRADGSSRFGPENKFGYFPSVSAGWLISNENFLKDSNLIQMLKLRASWGQVGNDVIGNFGYLASMVKGYNYVLGTDGIPQQSVVPGIAANPELKWETSEQSNIGLDLSILKSQLTFNADYYIKKTKDLLSTSPIPMFVGMASPLGNLGEISNKGVELSLTYRKINGDFNFSSSLMASYNKNEVTKVANKDGYVNGTEIDKELSGSLRMEEGFPFPFIYGYKTDGIFQNNSEVSGYINSTGEMIQPDARPGDIRYVDVDGSGVIDEHDRTYLGKVTPDWIFGLNFNAEYKNFDLTLLLQGQTGNKIANVSFIDAQNYSVRNVSATERWDGEGSTDNYPMPTLMDPNRNFSRLNDMVHVESGDYLRVKNLQVGYTLPVSLLKNAGISGCRVFISSQNLFTFTKYKGFDPEIGQGNTGGFLDFGIDRAAYPQARTFTSGVSVTF